MTTLEDFLEDLEIYLDNRSDINNEGGPNEAMRLLRDPHEVKPLILKLDLDKGLSQ